MAKPLSSKLINKCFVVPFSEDGKDYDLHISYGFNVFGKQNPYLIIHTNLFLCEGSKRIYTDSNLSRDKLIEKHAPELYPLLKWEGMCSESGAQKYEENAIYWWKNYFVKDVADRTTPSYIIGDHALIHFNKTIVLGAIENESICLYSEANDITEQKMRECLRARLPKLLRAFRKEMIKFGLMEADKYKKKNK